MTIELPAIERYQQLVAEIFASGRVTNNGAMHDLLEQRIAEALDAPYFLLTSSATLALQVAFKVFDLRGDIITSPYTWITTASSMRWIGLTPQFIDIDQATLNIDPELIAEHITQQTSAIVPVHLFGNPCDVGRIADIARSAGLPVIYDAAHAFGSLYNSRHVPTYGDAGVVSFHATKILHTVEGGGLILHSEDDYLQAKILINNGMDASRSFVGIGINGRLSELHAAMGLCLFDKFQDRLARRRILAKHLQHGLNGSGVEWPRSLPGAEPNHAFVPIILADDVLANLTEAALEAADIPVTRHFSTLLNRMPFLAPESDMPAAQAMCNRVLCLPLESTMTLSDIDRICSVVRKTLSCHG